LQRIWADLPLEEDRPEVVLVGEVGAEEEAVGEVAGVEKVETGQLLENEHGRINQKPVGPITIVRGGTIKRWLGLADLRSSR
jgi:hypothetical protein